MRRKQRVLTEREILEALRPLSFGVDVIHRPPVDTVDNSQQALHTFSTAMKALGGSVRASYPRIHNPY